LKSDGKAKTECKVLGAGVMVREYARDDADFIAAYGKDANKKSANIIFNSDIGFVNSCTTDATGTCSMGVPTPTKYLAVAKLVYRGVTGYKVAKEHFKSKTHDGSDKDEEEHDDVDLDSSLNSFPTMISKMLRFEIVVDKNGVTRINPAAQLKQNGSVLEVVYPEYIIWSDSLELFPFILTSADTWTADVCLAVPEGYKIAAVVDEEGNALPTSDCAQSFVAGESKAILFTVADIGSPEPNFNFTLKTKHQEAGSQVVKETKSVVAVGGIRSKTKVTQDAQLATAIVPIIAKIEAEKKAEGVKLAQVYKPVITSNVKAQVQALKFDYNMSFGKKGADVKALQIYLNDKGFAVSSSGAGSPGNETNFFGPKTKAALTKFQEAYAGDILAPLGLKKGTGIFGAKTRAYINSHQ
jgi:hypothetical protein